MTDKYSVKELSGFMQTLGHSFQNPELLVSALTHPSISAAKGEANSYERLEFLGDRVLGLIMAEWLLEEFPREREGDIAKRHAALVRREALDVVAEEIDLKRYLRLTASKGDNVNRSVTGDACEAVIGALYLDAGLEKAREFVKKHWLKIMREAELPPMDPKTMLQEWLLAKGVPVPVYEVVSQSGPAHAPVFEIKVKTDLGQEEAVASGSSKREAEKKAATLLLQKLIKRSDNESR